MNPKQLPILFVLILLTLLPVSLQAVPAWPGPIETTQPDGSRLTVRIIGDEWYHFYESDDGFAIVQDQDSWWVYADLDDRGEYVPTRFVVGGQDVGTLQFRATAGEHLRETSAEKLDRRELFYERTLPGILEKAEDLFGKGAKASISVPVVLVQYPDFAATQTVASFTNMMNQTNYSGTGSFQDYYKEISYGNLTVTATVAGWYTAPNNCAYYKYGTGTLTEWDRARGLVRNAVDSAETAGFNWAPFDNNGDGQVDVVFIVHQGPGAECGSTNYIWSHHWFLNIPGNSNLSRTYDGVLIDSYIMTPELGCGGGHIEIGVSCHEFGHALGLPDLYDVDGSSAGIGSWCLMASGSWGGNGTTPQTPVHMCAWAKIQQGWITPTVVTTNTTGSLIPNVESNATAFKLWTGGTPGQQYFLAENRQKTGFDANLRTGGLAIWHIDEAMRKTDNTDNANENHKLVDLEEADGLAQMDASASNRGDAGDLFPGSTSNTLFNDTTNPDAKDYASANTQVCASSISASASTMTADFCVNAAGSGPDFVIRDCAADVGAEPDLACNGNWVQSLDIWIDNNDDGVIDAPIKGQVNHLYVRGWNIGTASTNAKIQCWYVNPSLGLNFGLGSPGTQIVDAVSGATQLTIPTVNPLAPTPGGTGYRDYFRWMIPSPPPNIDHYCIGCVMANAADPQTSAVPMMENGLGQINYWAFVLKAGTTPAKTGAQDSTTIFRQEVRVYNRYAEETTFLIRVDGLPPEWGITAEPDSVIVMPALGESTALYDIVKLHGAHQDSAQVRWQMYKLPEMELAGAIVEDLAIDNLPPTSVRSWSVDHFQPQGDNLARPIPTDVLSWELPEVDIGGFPEKVRYFDIYGGEDFALVDALDVGSHLARTYGDDDPYEPGFQYYAYHDPAIPYYYTVVPVDMAGNEGEKALVESPEQSAPIILATNACTFSGSGFPAIGVIDYTTAGLANNSIRIDIAQNISNRTDLRNDPGDSMTMTIASVRAGAVLVGLPELHVRMRANALFDGVRTLPAGFTKIGQIIEGTVLADTTYTRPIPTPIPSLWNWDLPDTGFFFPGDVFHWYVKAQDVVGTDVGTSLLPADTTGFSAFPGNPAYISLRYPSNQKVRGLPSMPDTIQAHQPHILWWNDNENRGFENEWFGALDQLGYREGIDYDVYYNNAAASGVGNGLGGRASETQLAGYQTLLYDCGTLQDYLIANGDYNEDPSRDVQVLEAWFALGNKNAFFSGEDLAENLQAAYSGPLTAAFMVNRMGILYAGGDVRTYIGNQATPWVKPIVGNPPGLTVDYIAFGRNQDINDFDRYGANTAAGASNIMQWTSPTGATGYSTYAAAVYNPGADGCRVISMPYDFGLIFDKTMHAGGQPIRNNLLSQILTFFGNLPSGGTPVGVPDAGRLFARNYPNPFNPGTKIEFSLPRACQVELKIYNVRGELVRTLLNQTMNAGTSSVLWNGVDSNGQSVSSGVYFYSLKADGYEKKGKIALVK